MIGIKEQLLARGLRKSAAWNSYPFLLAIIAPCDQRELARWGK